METDIKKSTKKTTTDDQTRLVGQLAFYGAYHSNFWNQLIHILFVPLIWWACVILTCYIPVSLPLFEVPVPLVPILVITGYIGYYLSLGNLYITGSYSIVLILMGYHAINLYLTNSLAWIWGITGNIIGWVLQIVIGHNICEGRKPALLDSLFDAIIMAPLFTWYEISFMLGFNSALKRDLDKSIEKLQKEMDTKTKIK